MSSDTHEIVPEGFDKEALHDQLGKNPDHDTEILRCRHCGRARVFFRKSGPTDHYCETCRMPIKGIYAATIEQAKTMGDSE
jgi:ribosomal protein S14